MAKPGEPEAPITRAALIPASLVSVFLLIYVAHLPFGVAAASSLPFLVLFVVAPFWARRSAARFDRDAVRLLTTDRKSDLPRRFARALGMRLFAPAAHVEERRGLVASELGRAREARRAYRKAMKAYEDPDDAPMPVLLGYAHASYALGDDVEAIRAYRKVLGAQGPMPRLERNLAHALIRRNEDVHEAMAMLDRADAQAATGEAKAEIALIRALGDATRGRRATAKEALAAHRDAEDETIAKLVAEVEEAL
jgi:tetratricopeptide (TPR) repeat protein